MQLTSSRFQWNLLKRCTALSKLQTGKAASCSSAEITSAFSSENKAPDPALQTQNHLRWMKIAPRRKKPPLLLSIWKRCQMGANATKLLTDTRTQFCISRARHQLAAVLCSAQGKAPEVTTEPEEQHPAPAPALPWGEELLCYFPGAALPRRGESSAQTALQSCASAQYFPITASVIVAFWNTCSSWISKTWCWVLGKHTSRQPSPGKLTALQGAADKQAAQLREHGASFLLLDTAHSEQIPHRYFWDCQHVCRQSIIGI